MKGLDTPVLLEILRGRKRAATLLGELEGEELATTEINLYELEVMARSGPRQGLDRRLAGLDSLRRKLTVLPLDERATKVAALRSSFDRMGGGATQGLILGIAEASGCVEWITSRSSRGAAPSGKMRLRQVRM